MPSGCYLEPQVQEWPPVGRIRHAPRESTHNSNHRLAAKYKELVQRIQTLTNTAGVKSVAIALAHNARRAKLFDFILKDGPDQQARHLPWTPAVRFYA